MVDFSKEENIRVCIILLKSHEIGIYIDHIFRIREWYFFALVGVGGGWDRIPCRRIVVVAPGIHLIAKHPFRGVFHVPGSIEIRMWL